MSDQNPILICSSGPGYEAKQGMHSSNITFNLKGNLVQIFMCPGLTNNGRDKSMVKL